MIRTLTLSALLACPLYAISDALAPIVAPIVYALYGGLV